MRIDYQQALEEGQTYHIYNKSTSGNRMFENEVDYIDFLEKWRKYFGHYLETFAFCLVPNHFHFLVQVKLVNNGLRKQIESEATKAGAAYISKQVPLSTFLSDQLRRFGSSVSLSHRAKHSRDGPLFVGKIKRIALKSDPHILYVLCYIHH